MIFINTKKKKKIKIFIFIIILLLILLGLTQAFASDQNKNNRDIINNNTAPPNNIINENNKIVENIINIDNNEITNQITEKPVKESNNKEIRNFGSNVAFIGDSRTQAFLMYAGLKDVVDYTNVGLMVDTAISKKFITNKHGEKITILEDLKTKNIDTIYIMLGINELGWVYNSIFIEKYEELIDSIKEIKLNCEIIIQSIIPVTKTKSDNDDIYNNQKINEYNVLIKEMAEKKELNILIYFQLYLIQMEIYLETQVLMEYILIKNIV